VTHAVRTNLATLLVGVVLQRVLQLAAFLCIGRALGPERLGVWAQGLATAALLAIVAGAGVRNLLTRAVARSPAAARVFVLRAIRTRLVAGLGLAALGTAVAFATSEQPWFWTLCVLQVLPAAFELKNLFDAAGRTRLEVALETGTSLLQLLLIGAWMVSGSESLVVLAAIALASRCVYAAAAIPAIARLPRARADAVPAPQAARVPAAVVLGQTANELVAAGDVWLVALCFGDGAAGLWSVATRFAAAALLPSAQLARLLLPHLLHAGNGGDAARTLRTAARATALATVPMLAGGAMVAGELCSLPGPQFAIAAPALVLALLAGCLQHAGWQRSHALLALGRDGLYAATLAAPALLQVLGVVGCSALGIIADDATAATAAAAIAAVAQLVYFGWSANAVRGDARPERLGGAAGPAMLAACTGLAAALPRLAIVGPWLLPSQLVAGGLAFAFGLWFVELRGRTNRVGDSLVAASGFRR